MIACGGVKSNAAGRMDKQLSEDLKRKKWSEKQMTLYGSELRAVLERDAEIAKGGVDPLRVAKTVERALLATQPEPLYTVWLSKVLASISSMPATKVDDLFISMIEKSDRT